MKDGGIYIGGLEGGLGILNGWGEGRMGNLGGIGSLSRIYLHEDHVAGCE